ncbi:MAG TPA: nucleotidyltransferase family protein [Gaiellaceae bacterium]
MEAIILAGGRAERLGEAAQGKPKPLVRVGGRPLAAWQVGLLARAGVGHVIVSCAAGAGESFERELSGLGPRLSVAEETEPLGRGGGIRFAASRRQESGDLFVLNGDELLDVEFEALRAQHERSGAAATIVVVRPRSPFGVVELDGDRVAGFSEGGTIDCWVSCGVYMLGDEALERFPARGDHETTTFPELADSGRLAAYRHEGVWLTVNTPKDLRLADEYLRAHPAWLTGVGSPSGQAAGLP